jgi:hypothetical protein
MKDNITNKIALQLQELSGAFRKKQQEYLQCEICNLLVIPKYSSNYII